MQRHQKKFYDWELRFYLSDEIQSDVERTFEFRM